MGRVVVSVHFRAATTHGRQSSTVMAYDSLKISVLLLRAGMLQSGVLVLRVQRCCNITNLLWLSATLLYIKANLMGKRKALSLKEGLWQPAMCVLLWTKRPKCPFDW
jgi:hypothetical protein